MRPKLKRRIAALGLVALGALALSLPAISSAGRNTVTVEAKLKGVNEVPGPGDNNGRGETTVKLKAKKHKVCFTLEVAKLDPMVAGHIHKGTEDVAGKVKVTLFEDPQGLSGDGSYEGCVTDVKKRLVKKMGKVPEKFYVNLHTETYPDGAIRGQLAEPKPN